MKTSDSIEIATARPTKVSGAIEPAMYVRTIQAPGISLPSVPRAAMEKYRVAAVRLESLLDARPPLGARTLGRLILVTSPEVGAGKTTTALNLASALSGMGRRVALVELDRSRPGLATMLGLPPSGGLGDVLAGAARLDDVVYRTEDDGPIILPGGQPHGHLPSAASVLATVNALREVRDMVIVDCAALADSADAAVLGRVADGVLLVVRANATRGPALAAALDALVDAPLLGCILNDLDGTGGDHAHRSRQRGLLLSAPSEDEED